MTIAEHNSEALKVMSENFRLMRRRNGWSIGELSTVTGIDADTLKKMEQGRDFDIRFLIQLCQHYHVKPHRIFLRIE